MVFCKIKKNEILTEQEERKLFAELKNNNNKKAGEKIVNAHLRLVIKIASSYQGYGLSQEDLISEGNIGVLKALRNFNPKKGCRFSTYAMWWIKANIQEYIMHNCSLVKIGTTRAQKKLFFNLRRMQENLKDKILDNNYSQKKFYDDVSKKLNVTSQEVKEMDTRMNFRENSLNTPLSDESGAAQAQDFLPDPQKNVEENILERNEFNKRHAVFSKIFNNLDTREKQIIVSRRLKEKPLSLNEVSLKLGLSRERIRQIENNTLDKIQKQAYIFLPEKK